MNTENNRFDRLHTSSLGYRRGAYGPMAYKRENFRLSGPLHLTAVDWKNPHDRRSVAASLVRGVYVLERDRQQKRRGLRALAPTWWDFFHFKLVHVLVDNADLSIFGAVYEFKFPPSECNCSDQTLLAPTYVVAFRGLIPTPDIMSQDFNLYFHFIQNRLQQNSRFQLAMQSVQNVAVLAGAANIWLTGHSMGSAIALLAGKNMGKAGYLIDTYLFNPPFISAAPTERIEDQNLKHGIRFISSVITAGIAVAVNGLHQRSQKENSFAVLSGWTPYLFVNPSDPICSEYIGYFQHREKMVEVGAGEIARLATQISIESLLSGLEASHLVPSAYLTTNLSTVQDFRQAHGIQQWWQPNIRCQFKLYQFN